MPDNQGLSHLSDHFLIVAVVLYSLAVIAFAADFAFGRRSPVVTRSQADALVSTAALSVAVLSVAVLSVAVLSIAALSAPSPSRAPAPAPTAAGTRWRTPAPARETTGLRRPKAKSAANAITASEYSTTATIRK